MRPELDYSKKVCLVGGPGSGKTALLGPAVFSKFDAKFIDSLGYRSSEVTFSHELSSSGEAVRVVCHLSIWDITENPKLRKTQDLWSRGADAAVVVVRPEDPTAIASFLDWAKRFRASPGEIPLLLLLNLSEPLAMSEFSKFQEAASQLGARMAASSSSTPNKTRQALEELSVELAREVAENQSRAARPGKARRPLRFIRSKAGGKP